MLRKHAYSNTQKISPPKTENFQIKNSDIFPISAVNIDCRYSLEPPRIMEVFLSRNKKNNVYPCKPQFYYIKVGLKGVKIIWACFRDEVTCTMTRNAITEQHHNPFMSNLYFSDQSVSNIRVYD